MKSDDQTERNNHNQSHEDPFDLDKFLMIARRSVLWALLFVFIGVGTAYLIVRYTKPLFESSSVIKLEFENEANVLGLVDNGLQQDLSEVSGEIEILKSKLFFTKVVRAIDYNVSYHFYGRYLTDERYGNSPFVVSYKLKNIGFYDQPFDLQFIDENSFELFYTDGGQPVNTRHKYGKEIINDNFNLQIDKTEHWSSESNGRYYFVIQSEEALIDYFQENCQVVPENFNAKTIKISLQDFNKQKAQNFLTAIDTLYLDYTRDTKNTALDQKIKFLDEQIAMTEQRLEEFEGYFEEFTIENMTVSLEGDIARTIIQLEELDSQRFLLKKKLVDIEVLTEQMIREDEITIDPYSVTLFPEVIQEALEAYTIDLDLKLEKLSSYNENSYIVQQISRRLVKSRGGLLDLLDGYKKDLNQRNDELSNRRNSLESNFEALPSRGTEYNKNRRVYALQESFLEALRQSKMELELTKAGTVTNGILLSSASIEDVPIKPEKLLILGVGFVASLVFSLFFVAIRYLLNNKISSAQELEKLIPVPILGSLPFYSKEKLTMTKLIVRPNSKSALSESLRTIRTNIEFLNPGVKARTITITSTVSGEGKTFVAVNLGAIMASTQMKVCVVDLDMRKPKAHIAFGHSAGKVGASTCLARKSEIDDCIVDTEIDNLKYIPAGPTPPNPSELVLSDQFDQFVASLKSKFDFVILDTPPVGLVTDAILVMKKTDLQFYVVKSQYSRRSFTRTIHDLVNVNDFDKIAVILNGVKRMSNSSYGYGSYGYGSYGYGYYEEEVQPKNKFLTFLNSFY